MYKFLLSLLLLCSIKSLATNYYFSTSGNDANTGTSITSPFKTITKLNTLALVAGDSIFFKKGDIFRGQITVTASGSSLQPIVFSSYGTGNAPIISGAELVTGFTQNGSKYEKILSQKTNNFFVNDKEQTLARYPNNGRYLWLDSAQKTYLKDADLASLPSNYINNSRVCVHTAQWCWEKSAVSSYNNAEKITYNTQMSLAAIANYGYFLYDNINLLDTAQEWKFDSTTMLLSYMPATGVNPNSVSCEVAVYTDGIKIMGNASYISILNIVFDKQMNAGVSTASTNNKYIRIDGCSFYRQYNHGFADKGKYNTISNCFFREVDGIAVFVSSSGAGNTTVSYNTFRNIGAYRNSGIGAEINLSAIKFGFVDSCYAHHNDIDSTGYCGISADGGYHVVEKNIIKNAMLLNNDGAALKSYGSLSHHITFRNNFVSSSDGNTEGTTNANFITPAIYFDFNVNNCIVQDNTVYNRTQKGIFQNAGNYNNSLIGNNIYGANYGIDLNGHPNQGIADTLNGYVIKRNAIFLKTANDFIYRQVDFSNLYQVGYVDSNYYYQPYATNKFMQRPSATPQTYSFASWQAAGFDVHAKTNTFQWSSGVDSSQIFINPTDNAVQQTLGGWVWRDLDGNLVTSLILQPWTSKILIRTATALPLTFTNFTATLNKETVTTTWETANEVNVSHYNVQRSFTAIDAAGQQHFQFENIGNLKANNKYSNSYYFLDEPTKIEKHETFFYRIEAVDKDGKTTYSSIQKITLNNINKIALQVFPNPATSFINIVCQDEIKTIRIVNTTGKLLQQKNGYSNTQQINIQSLSKGIYFIIVETKLGKSSTEKLLVL